MVMAMSETVVVALIAAASTISGGVLGATTSIVIQRRQVKEQERLAERDRNEQWSVRQRGLRREAYVQLLTCFDEVDGSLQKCWQMQPESSASQSLPREITEATGSLASFMTALNVVKLEGPQSVVDASLSASEALRAEFKTVARQAVRHAGGTDTLLVLAHDDFDAALNERQRVKQALITAAQEALQRIPLAGSSRSSRQSQSAERA
jgi:hypothetical protein